jgi:hypothetical protein
MTVPARLSFQSTLTILLTIFRTAERTWLQERKARRGKPEESRDRRKAGTDGAFPDFVFPGNIVKHRLSRLSGFPVPAFP